MSRPALRAAAGLLALLAALALPAAAQTGRPTDTGEAGRPAVEGELGQAPVVLVADEVRVEGNDRLVASGNVEVLSAGNRLRARQITYDRATGRIELEGPVRLRDPDGTLIVAEGGELSEDLQEGILRAARIILDQRLQIAGAEMARRDGRFGDLRRVAATSCQLCGPNEVPLWEIRAARVIHDQDEAQIYFYNARFRIGGLPVFYLPTLRIPDGTNPRVRGFLVPSVRSTTELGTGVLLPYFIPLGDHADVTLTPYVSEGGFNGGNTRTLQGRYRQAFRNGSIEAEGAVSRDALEPGDTRGYLFANGRFEAPRDYVLRFDLETTSDDPYLRDYDISTADRLESSVRATRYLPGERIDGQITHFQSLRADTDDSNDPVYVGDLVWNQRQVAPELPLWLDLDVFGQIAERDNTTDGTGRDTGQVRARAAASGAWTGPMGLRFGAEADVFADFKTIREDDRFPSQQAGVTPRGALTLSWPLARTESRGARQLITPTAQLVWAAEDPIDDANDDSTSVALDTGNIFALSRFPGLDRTEAGARADLLLRWQRIGATNLVGLSGGRILRFSERDQFFEGSGLNGATSDWLTALDFDIGRTLSLRAQSLFDDELNPRIAEARLLVNAGPADLATSYVWQRGDSDPDLDGDVSEVAAVLNVEGPRGISGSLGVRRDFAIGETTETELGLAYENECVRVAFSVAQDFRATSSEEQTTSYGFSVELAGLGSSRPNRVRACGPRG